MLKKHRILAIAATAVCAVAMIGAAGAQLNNKPYSFRNSPGGGPGTSLGGKQTIINEKLFDETPHNLQRGPDGGLVDVVEGPGKSVIVFQHGATSSIPGFHGTSFRGDSGLMAAGVFNAYFGPDHDSNTFVNYGDTQFHTAGLINSWTLGVAAGHSPFPYNASNPVDSWTAFVNSLNRF